MNGRDFYTSTDGVNPARPDELLAPAAERVYELADPYIAVASLADRDPDKCLEMARQIIADPLATDQGVTWAHVLVGDVLRDQHMLDEAIAEYHKAIGLNPRFAMAHSNLCAKGQTKEAIAECKEAIEVAARFALPHYNLGVVLSDQGKTEEAIAECRKAIDLDPRNAFSHFSLGYVLSYQGKTEEAISEFRKAIDPRDADPHHNLAVILRAQGMTKEADAEHQKDKELGGKHPD